VDFGFTTSKNAHLKSKNVPDGGQKTVLFRMRKLSWRKWWQPERRGSDFQIPTDGEFCFM